MTAHDRSILLIGESGVGKTHYGAQLLKRLMKGDGLLRMNGAATNLEPFEAAMESLNEGVAAGHTATSTYIDSIWPISDGQGRSANLVWPDYGGEQIKAMTTSRRIPVAWRSRVAAPSWLLLVRLQQARVADDIFSKPLSELKGAAGDSSNFHISDQARLIELLQILLYLRNVEESDALESPRLCVLLTCWDELDTDQPPVALLGQRFPMLASFVRTRWAEPLIFGLSALERALSPRERDPEYAARGPEQFGYIVMPGGGRTSDLTIPIQRLLA